MASQARPWRRLPSMIRGPAPVPVPPAPTPAPAAPPPASPLARPPADMPTSRAASPLPPPETQLQREPTPPPPPPPAVAASPPLPSAPPAEPSIPRTPPTRGSTSGSVPSTPVSRPVTAAQVSSSLSSLPPSPAPARGTSPPAVTKPPVLSPRASAPTSPIQTQNGLSTSSAPSPPPPPSITATTKDVPVPSPRMVSKREITPVPSPTKVIKPEAEAKITPQSPKPRLVAPPPSPSALPPTQIKTIEAEQKKVLVHENVPVPIQKHHRDGEMHRESVGETRKHGHSSGIMDAQKKQLEKKHLDSEEAGVKLITIAGENKGAVMELIRSPKTGTFLHRRGNTTDSKESGISSSGGGEGKQKMKDKSLKSKATLSPPATAFMNSNVQGINNSIVYNSSFTHHDPGIHLSFSRTPSPSGGHHVKESSKAKGHQS